MDKHIEILEEAEVKRGPDGKWLIKDPDTGELIRCGFAAILDNEICRIFGTDIFTAAVARMVLCDAAEHADYVEQRKERARMSSFHKAITVVAMAAAVWLPMTPQVIGHKQNETKADKVAIQVVDEKLPEYKAAKAEHASEAAEKWPEYRAVKADKAPETRESK